MFVHNVLIFSYYEKLRVEIFAKAINFGPQNKAHCMVYLKLIAESFRVKTFENQLHLCYAYAKILSAII